MTERTINKKLINRNHTALKRGKGDIKYIVVHYVGALGDARANCEMYYEDYLNGGVHNA